MNWAPFLERLGGLLTDLPARLALAGLGGCLTVGTGLAWWASHHHVQSTATGWRLTTWEDAMEAERRAAGRALDQETDGEATDQLDWQEVT